MTIHEREFSRKIGSFEFGRKPGQILEPQTKTIERPGYKLTIKIMDDNRISIQEYDGPEIRFRFLEGSMINQDYLTRDLYVWQE